MKKIILNSFLVFLIIGCTSTNPIPTLIVNTSTPIVPTLSPTATLEPPQVVCSKVRQVDVSEVKSQGKMIFTSLHYQGYIVNANNFEQIKIDSEEDMLFSIAISPNRQLTAYQLYSRNSDNFTLVVTGFDGTPELTIPWEEDWAEIASWLDDQNLLINLVVEMADEDISAKEFSTFLVFNPFTGERKILEPNFPEIYSHHMFSFWENFGSTVYNSSLDRVVYIRGGHFSEDGYYRYTLWSITENRELSNFKIVVGYEDVPKWSPDGEKFIIPVSHFGDNWPSYNFYLVNKNGEIKNLIDFSKYFSFSYIDQFNWSPDGKYIAFWFSGWEETPDFDNLNITDYLAIIDIESKEFSTYCISGKANRYWVTSAPVWSPDGTQILVESPLSNEHSQVLLLDLEKEVIAKIGEDMIPVGWMIEP